MFPRESTRCTVDSQALFTLVYRIILPYILSKPNETIIFLLSDSLSLAKCKNFHLLSTATIVIQSTRRKPKG